MRSTAEGDQSRCYPKQSSLCLSHSPVPSSRLPLFPLCLALLLAAGSAQAQSSSSHAVAVTASPVNLTEPASELLLFDLRHAESDTLIRTITYASNSTSGVHLIVQDDLPPGLVLLADVLPGSQRIRQQQPGGQAGRPRSPDDISAPDGALLADIRQTLAEIRVLYIAWRQPGTAPGAYSVPVTYVLAGRAGEAD